MTACDLLTPLEVARLLRFSLTTVYELIAKGEIPATRLGRQYRIPRAALEALLVATTRT